MGAAKPNSSEHEIKLKQSRVTGESYHKEIRAPDYKEPNATQ